MRKEKIEIIAKELQIENSEKIGTVIFHGNTMFPFLKDGDEVVMIPIQWEEIRIGDIIIYRLEDKFPTYRVIKKIQNGLVLKADNWNNIVSVWKDDVLGRIVRRKRGNFLLSCNHWRWIFYSKRAIYKYRISNFISRLKFRVSKIKKSFVKIGVFRRCKRKRYFY